MSRNRKSQSAAIRFGQVLKAVVLCLLMGGVGVGYVWQKEQIDKLGQQIKEREAKLRYVRDQNDKLSKQLAKLRSPAVLESRIKEMNLGLVRPDATVVWRMTEPPGDGPGKMREPRYPLQATHLPAAP